MVRAIREYQRRTGFKASVLHLCFNIFMSVISSDNVAITCILLLVATCQNRSLTRGVQKVPSLTQLTTRYAHRILSLFNIDTFFYNGIKALEKRWTKCISVAGGYVEK